MMVAVESYGLVTLAVAVMLEGLGRWHAILRFSIDRGSASKMMLHATPSGLQRKMPVRPPMLTIVKRRLDLHRPSGEISCARLVE